MHLLLLITVMLLVGTKLLDAFSTYVRILHSGQESNPLARSIMEKIGTGKAIGMISLVAIALIALSARVAFNSGPIIQCLFVLMGTIISLVQGAVAHCNWTGAENQITRIIRKWHSRLHHWLRKRWTKRDQA